MRRHPGCDRCRLTETADYRHGISASETGPCTDVHAEQSLDHAFMTYAIIWNENNGPDYAGKLELTAREAHLAGGGRDVSSVHRDLPYSDLDNVYLERCAPARNTWEPALVLITHSGDRIAIGSLEGLGALHELAESLVHRRDRIAA